MAPPAELHPSFCIETSGFISVFDFTLFGAASGVPREMTVTGPAVRAKHPSWGLEQIVPGRVLDSISYRLHDAPVTLQYVQVNSGATKTDGEY